jgi:excisionase family DNA binding protein
MTVKQAAAFLECGRTKLYALMDKGLLPWVPFDGQRRIRTDDLVALTRRGTRARKAA